MAGWVVYEWKIEGGFLTDGLFEGDWLMNGCLVADD